MGRPKKVQSNVVNFSDGIAVRPAVDLRTKYVPKKYIELRQKVVPNGIVEEEVVVDYPVTPESVKSFSDSTDFKRDLNGNLKSGRTNLGDCTDLQSILNMDSENARRAYSRLQDTLNAANKSADPVDPVDPVDPANK